MDWGAVRRGVPGSEGGGGGDKSGGHRPHGNDERDGEPAGWLALAVGDEHRHVGALLEVAHRDACGNERTLEGEAAAGQEGDQVIPPEPGYVSWLGHQVPVLPDPVRGQVRAQVGAGRQARRRAAGRGHIEQRAGAGVAAGEPLELAGGVPRQDDQVGLSEPRRAARGRHPYARPEASASSGRRQVFQLRHAGGSGRAGSACACACVIAQAALIRPTWLNACGKLPISSPLPGSTSSASSPTSLIAAMARSNVAVAWSTSPASAWACASQNVQIRKVPSAPARPSAASYRYTRPRLSVSRAAIAPMVAFTRRSSAGRNRVIASIRLDASRSSLPKAWVNAPARSFQPCSRMAARISSRAAAQAATRSSAPSCGASAMARSRATQHMSLEYT